MTGDDDEEAHEAYATAAKGLEHGKVDLAMATGAVSPHEHRNHPRS
jgi:hypothetical protein